MNQIINNTYNQLNAYNLNTSAVKIDSDNDNLISNQDNKAKASNASDTIEIAETNASAINTIKAYSAFRDACKEFGTGQNSETAQAAVSSATSSTDSNSSLISSTEDASSSQLRYVVGDPNAKGDMSLYFNTALRIMENEGYDVPSFVPGENDSNVSYIKFLDTMKEYCSNLNTTNPGFLPDGFMDFLDCYQGKLEQYGCY